MPVGLELYSVRDELKKDTIGTVEGVAKMGYQVVEFFAPYYQWTPDYAKEMRKKLDDLGIRCNSTHNGPVSFSPDGIGKAIYHRGLKALCGVVPLGEFLFEVAADVHAYLRPPQSDEQLHRSLQDLVQAPHAEVKAAADASTAVRGTGTPACPVAGLLPSTGVADRSGPGIRRGPGA